MKSNDLNDKLCALYDDILAGRVKPIVATEANNTAGKLIGNTRNQIAFCVMQGLEPKIPYLSDCTTGEPIEFGIKTPKFLKPARR